MKKILSITILTLLIGCNKEDINSLRTCDQILGSTCNGTGSGEYCTFGFKWGANNPFANAGLEKPGPGSGQVQISYKFQEAGLVFSTHSQNDLKSESIDKLPACTKQKVREAFAAWEAVANVSFIEKASSEPTDIKVITANITQGGIGYPAFTDAPCTELAGVLVLRSNLNNDCDGIYGLILHEIGHTLGLGHVASNNVMNPAKSYQVLQFGDIKGIQSVYGTK